LIGEEKLAGSGRRAVDRDTGDIYLNYIVVLFINEDLRDSPAIIDRAVTLLLIFLSCEYRVEVEAAPVEGVLFKGELGWLFLVEGVSFEAEEFFHLEIGYIPVGR
jgi:hypothetical protein